MIDTQLQEKLLQYIREENYAKIVDLHSNSDAFLTLKNQSNSRNIPSLKDPIFYMFSLKLNVKFTLKVLKYYLAQGGDINLQFKIQNYKNDEVYPINFNDSLTKYIINIYNFEHVSLFFKFFVKNGLYVLGENKESINNYDSNKESSIISDIMSHNSLNNKQKIQLFNLISNESYLKDGYKTHPLDIIYPSIYYGIDEDMSEFNKIADILYEKVPNLLSATNIDNLNFIESNLYKVNLSMYWNKANNLLWFYKNAKNVKQYLKDNNLEWLFFLKIVNVRGLQDPTVTQLLKLDFINQDINKTRIRLYKNFYPTDKIITLTVAQYILFILPFESYSFSEYTGDILHLFKGRLKVNTIYENRIPAEKWVDKDYLSSSFYKKEIFKEYFRATNLKEGTNALFYIKPTNEMINILNLFDEKHINLISYNGDLAIDVFIKNMLNSSNYSVIGIKWAIDKLKKNGLVRRNKKLYITCQSRKDLFIAFNKNSQFEDVSDIYLHQATYDMQSVCLKYLAQKSNYKPNKYNNDIMTPLFIILSKNITKEHDYSKKNKIIDFLLEVGESPYIKSKFKVSSKEYWCNLLEAISLEFRLVNDDRYRNKSIRLKRLFDLLVILYKRNKEIFDVKNWTPFVSDMVAHVLLKTESKENSELGINNFLSSFPILEMDDKIKYDILLSLTDPRRLFEDYRCSLYNNQVSNLQDYIDNRNISGYIEKIMLFEDLIGNTYLKGFNGEDLISNLILWEDSQKHNRGKVAVLPFSAKEYILKDLMPQYYSYYKINYEQSMIKSSIVLSNENIPKNKKRL